MIIPVQHIIVGDRFRAADPRHVDGLAASIAQVGLLQPIVIDGERRLVAGLHRLRAVEALGWGEVEAVVRSAHVFVSDEVNDTLQAEDADHLDRQLAEIDENLVRKELSVLERAELTTRRKEVYDELYPTASKGGWPKGKPRSTERANAGNEFAAKLAANAGQVTERANAGNEFAAKLAANSDDEDDDIDWMDDDDFAPPPDLAPEPIIVQPRAYDDEGVWDSTDPVPSFTASTSKLTGVPERTIQRSLKIGTIDADVRDLVRDSPLADNQAWLEQVAKEKLRIGDPELEQAIDKGLAKSASKGAAADDIIISDEWYTPEHIIEAARDVLGAIDIDPASNAKAQTVVNATVWYDKQADSLRDEVVWKGRLWMNPPYSRGLVDRFCLKAIEQSQAGHLDAGIILLNASIETQYMQALFDASSAMCLLSGRIAFLHHESLQPVAQTRVGQVAVYLGPDPEAFCHRWSELGTCFTPWRAGGEA